MTRELGGVVGVVDRLVGFNSINSLAVRSAYRGGGIKSSTLQRETELEKHHLA